MDSHFSWFWFLGSVIPDIDHLFVLYRHRIFSFKRIVETMRFEDKYNLRFKTKYSHSILGAVIFSLPALAIDLRGGFYFFLAYILHLVLDWPDRDEKQYFYPLEVKIRGFLPIFSNFEKVFTMVLIGFLFFLYK